MGRRQHPKRNAVRLGENGRAPNGFDRYLHGGEDQDRQPDRAIFRQLRKAAGAEEDDRCGGHSGKPSVPCKFRSGQQIERSGQTTGQGADQPETTISRLFHGPAGNAEDQQVPHQVTDGKVDQRRGEQPPPFSAQDRLPVINKRLRQKRAEGDQQRAPDQQAAQQRQSELQSCLLRHSAQPPRPRTSRAYPAPRLPPPV